jgi:competence protein ComEC
VAPAVVRFAAAYAGGMWVASQIAPPPVPVLLGAVVVCGIGVGAGWRHRMAAALLAGSAVGSIVQRGHTETCAVQWQPGRHAAYVRVHDAPGSRGTTSVEVLHAPEGCRGRLRVRFDMDSLPASGMTAVVVGSVHTAGWLRVRHARLLPDRPIPLRFLLRERIAGRIRRLYGARAGLVDAVVLGRREDLDPDLRARFASAGLAHLLAISGLHVGMVAAWVRMAIRLVAGTRASWPLSAVVTWTYVALLGFPAPATRAAAFVAVAAIGRLRQRRPPWSAVLAVAALVVLAIDPGAVQSVGAWLSAAAVWGTASASTLMGRDRSAAVRLVSVSVGATLATAPITAAVFGSVAPVGVLSNLVAVPLAGIAVPAVFASLLAGSLLAGAAGLVLAALERVAAVAASVPFGHLSGEPGWPFAVPWVVILGTAVWATWRRPTWTVTGKRVAAVTAAASWILAAVPGRAGQGDEGLLAIHVLSVGQGDAIAIHTPAGRWILIDAGPRFGDRDAGRDVVLPFLKARGVRRLDVAVVSHGDADHLGGFPAVIEGTRPGLVVEPAQPLGTALYGEYLGAVDVFAEAWRAARAGDTLVVDSVVIAVLHPSARWMAGQVSPNENSLILHLRFGEFDALFTGDAGSPAESLLLPTLAPVEVLKVGHHGSAGSTSRGLVQAVRPAVGVISVGRNRFGHPTAVVLQRLRRAGTVVYRTDQGGTVTIRTDGRYYEVVQGESPQFLERARCVFQTWLRSSASSWSRSDCTRRPPENSRIFSTTSP